MTRGLLESIEFDTPTGPFILTFEGARLIGTGWPALGGRERRSLRQPWSNQAGHPEAIRELLPGRARLTLVSGSRVGLWNSLSEGLLGAGTPDRGWLHQALRLDRRTPRATEGGSSRRPGDASQPLADRGPVPSSGGPCRGIRRFFRIDRTIAWNEDQEKTA